MHERIQTVSASRAMIRSGERVVIEVGFETLVPTTVTVRAVTPGYSCEAAPVETRAGQKHCQLPIRIRRRNDAPGHVCLLEVAVGELHSSLSLTVLPRPRTHGALRAVGG